MRDSNTQNELELDEGVYNESEDEDFDPSATVAPGEDSSADDEDDEDAPSAQSKPTKSKQKKAGTKGQDQEAEDIGFENSGDEAVVKRGVKRRRKHGAAEAAEDSGGEGGFVKTRSMRATAAEEQDRRPLATTAGATIDVNALWAEMNDPKAGNRQQNTTRPPTVEGEAPKKGQVRDTKEPLHSQDTTLDDMVEIEETIKFAGEVQKRKKLVPRASEEAQKWLKAKDEPEEKEGVADLASTSKAKRHPDTGEPLLRPLRRVSLWDPNPTGVVKGLPTNILSDTTAGNKLRVVDKSKLDWHSEDTAKKVPKATKLNVVEKSKMDWEAHVDETGDKEELEKAAKAKGSYLERRDFLERVEARKDDEEMRRRVK